ncbi:radical SAM protein [uncultured Sphaerochaeta sp.]|uniref:radical SAM protein n=1 Tax=uncultured Sphaerochaeta sp. TaxID=886478 RepID=UPI0029CA50B1|nr:radical SAM protein [uncultured Sphaerochaeta sp.]
MDEHGMNAYGKCRLCPNYCAVNRMEGKLGRCGETDTVRIAWSGLHRGEEPPVTGEHGSGMIFFSGCPLHCAYCQNHQISGSGESGTMAVGIEVSTYELSNIMLELQKLGATNLNLVTGTHFIPSIVAALELAKTQGFSLDVVWNSSGFESPEGLSLIDPYIDLYLIDVKTLREDVSAEFCGLALYARIIRSVMTYILRNGRTTFVDDDGQLKGVLVRHLVFPGTLDASKEVLRYFAQELKDSCYLSLMVQFEPPKGDVRFPAISEEEYDNLLLTLEELDIEDGFVQELGENVSWIPDFTQENPFPEGFATPLPYFINLAKRSS